MTLGAAMIDGRTIVSVGVSAENRDADRTTHHSIGGLAWVGGRVATGSVDFQRCCNSSAHVLTTPVYEQRFG